MFVFFLVVAAVLATEYKTVPGGLRVHRDCIIDVPSGSYINVTAEKVFVNGQVVADCPFAPERDVGQYDGWLAYTQYESKNAGGFNVMTNLMNVPKWPANAPTDLYLFPGLQSTDWVPLTSNPTRLFEISQPVLDASSEYSSWTLASWYVTTSGKVLRSTVIPAGAEGSQIACNMTRTGPTSFFISGTTATGQATTLNVDDPERLRKQPYSYLTMECYGCGYDGCSSEFSTPLIFSDIKLVDASSNNEVPSWQPKTSPNPICDEHAIVSSPSLVKIVNKLST